MGLPNLLTPPESEEGWRDFWFYHFNDHLEIVQKFQKLGFNLPVYTIYPWVTEDKETILEQHQQYHNDMNSLLNVNGTDLSDIDFKNANEVQAWLYLNYQDHLAAHTTLDI